MHIEQTVLCVNESVHPLFKRSNHWCAGSDLHEVTRRLLSVLLREIDGFEAGGRRAVIIGATNRKQDLDAALISR